MNRAELTKAVLAKLKESGPAGIVGLHVAGGGWQGEPTSSEFIPYAILVPGSGTTSPVSTYSSDESDWRVRYTVSNYGVQAEQVQICSQRNLLSLEELTNTVVALERPYLVQQVRILEVGAITWTDQVNPVIYECRDSVELWISPV